MSAPRDLRPKLRPLETVVVPDERFGRALMLRDTEGITDHVAVIPAPLVPVLALFDGQRTTQQIVDAMTDAHDGSAIPSGVVEQIVLDLDRAFLLDSPRFRAHRERIHHGFARQGIRPAAHAGSAYHADPEELRKFIDGECLGAAAGEAAMDAGAGADAGAGHGDAVAAAGRKHAAASFTHGSGAKSTQVQGDARSASHGAEGHGPASAGLAAKHGAGASSHGAGASSHGAGASSHGAGAPSHAAGAPSHAAGVPGLGAAPPSGTVAHSEHPIRADAGRTAGTAQTGAHLVGLIAPHIDPWRGKKNYGHAYKFLRNTLAPDVDTFVILGTSHAPMRQPFALCRKPFETPLGLVPADLASIDAIAESLPFDPYADLFNHKREHSVEFQVVFIRHMLQSRPVQIIPILCGLTQDILTDDDPGTNELLDAFIKVTRQVIDRNRRRILVVAGADLAHVGPRFGDPKPYDARARRSLERTDRESLEFATRCAPTEFFAHVASDLDTRRVCGLAPIYTLLRLLPRGADGSVAGYEQTVDPEEGSIVSHAAVAFFGEK